jgi:membrane protein insertase Oxa1/YidC/SpoIIIJ
MDALQRRHAGDPARLAREVRALHAANGIRLFTPGGLVGFLVQAPLLGGLFAAVRGGLGARARFLWIADLSRPDALLVGVVALLTGAIVTMPGQPSGASAAGTIVALALGIGATVLFLWSASSAIALSVGAGSLVSGVQNWLIARESARPA